MFETTTRGNSAEKLIVTSGLGPRIGAYIDLGLSQEEKEKLHEKWDASWPTPIAHRGGTETITCESVLLVGYGKLSKVYGPHFAKRLISVAEERKVHVR